MTRVEGDGGAVMKVWADNARNLAGSKLLSAVERLEERSGDCGEVKRGRL